MWIKTQCNRTKSCKLGIAAFAATKGKCDLCHCWLNTGARQVEGTVAETFKICSAILPDYFVEFHNVIGQIDPPIESEELMRHESPEYIRLLILYLEMPMDRELVGRDLLDAAKLKRLEEAEKEQIEGLKKRYPQVSGMAFHSSLRRTVNESFE